MATVVSPCAVIAVIRAARCSFSEFVHGIFWAWENRVHDSASEGAWDLSMTTHALGTAKLLNGESSASYQA